MGGLSINVGIKRLENGKSGTPADVHHQIWACTEALTHEYCSAAAYGNTLFEYQGAEIEENKRSGLWSADEKKLSFGFTDASGCCFMSMYASLHWIEMGLASDSSADSFGSLSSRAANKGFAYDPPLPRAHAMLARGPEHPLLVLRGALFCITRRKPGEIAQGPVQLFSDDGVRVPAFNRLSVADRAKLLRAALTGTCYCALCRELTRWCTSARSGDRFRRPGSKGEKPTADTNLFQAWAALEKSKEGHQPACAAAKAVESWVDADWQAEPRGPAELQQIEAWLAAHKAKPSRTEILGLCHNRNRKP
jgi:hypothetical protein